MINNTNMTCLNPMNLDMHKFMPESIFFQFPKNYLRHKNIFYEIKHTLISGKELI